MASDRALYLMAVGVLALGLGNSLANHQPDWLRNLADHSISTAQQVSGRAQGYLGMAQFMFGRSDAGFGRTQARSRNRASAPRRSAGKPRSSSGRNGPHASGKHPSGHSGADARGPGSLPQVGGTRFPLEQGLRPPTSDLGPPTSDLGPRTSGSGRQVFFVNLRVLGGSLSASS